MATALCKPVVVAEHQRGFDLICTAPDTRLGHFGWLGWDLDNLPGEMGGHLVHSNEDCERGVKPGPKVISSPSIVCFDGLEKALVECTVVVSSSTSWKLEPNVQRSATMNSSAWAELLVRRCSS